MTTMDSGEVGEKVNFIIFMSCRNHFVPGRAYRGYGYIYICPTQCQSPEPQGLLNIVQDVTLLVAGTINCLKDHH